MKNGGRSKSWREVKDKVKERTGEKKIEPKKRTIRTWTGLRKLMFKGKTSKLFTSWIRKNIRKHGLSFTFKLQEIMTVHGMKYRNTLDYSRASIYFMKQRRGIEKAMELFWQSDEYKEYINNGHSEDGIFSALIKAAVKCDVYPMWADPYDDNKYKLFDFDSYINLKEKRTRATVSEIKRISKELQTAGQGIPQLADRYKRAVLQKGEYEALSLPSPKRYRCEICASQGKDVKFKSQADIARHYLRKHPDDLERIK